MPKKSNTPIKAYKKKDGKTYYMFKVYLGLDPMTGKPQYTTRRGFKSVKEAQSALTRIQFEIANGTFQKRTYESYRDLYDAWVESYKNTVEESTLNKTLKYFEHHILPAIGDYRIEQLNVDICQKFVNRLHEKLVKARTVKAYASKVLDYAIKRDLIQSNPFKLVEMPKKRAPKKSINRVERNFYSKEELNRLLSLMKEESNRKAYVAIHVLAFTGMRIGELTALTWEDIDFDKKEMTINKSIGRGVENNLYEKSTKTGTSRTISLDDETINLLKEWQFDLKNNLGRRFKKKKQLVMPNEENNYLQQTKTRKWLNYVINKYKPPPLTTHGLRHTHTSLLIESGANMKQVQQRLGHSDIKTTMDIYTHLTAHAEKETVNLFTNSLKS
ncbi:site-specific integrase [Lysinibacillus odysseyi]|uniref:Integrase n=1 Tax=Lysinibacillus odysseyi 34hs-1 = NBRC 100172 TaxID=1220589 RepID=A0A0A3J6W2_9BACI|nr:site-specific integrase [Lysinibacillus odysseyi]KGR82772.1 integrase [Lysinibacillus odysseyi 34hs-1 = NBRC 100172]